MKRAVVLTQDEWNTVTAALLCLRDRDDERGAVELSLEAEGIRERIRSQLSGKVRSRRQAGKSMSAAELFTEGQKILKGGR